jgi:membrane-associated phospholipid phosphatase
VTLAWLGALWLVNTVLFTILAWVSVRTTRGQMLDTVALYGNGLGRRTVSGPLDAALGAVSVVSTVLVLLVIAGVAMARRRVALAVMSAAVVVGATLTTLVLKRWIIGRPFLGIDPDRAFAGNSLPSGHTTAAAAFAIGLTLVAPPRARGPVSLVGATYAAVVGVATLSSGWHRPSDVVAAYLVVGGWAAFAGLILVLTQRPTDVVTRRERSELSLAAALALGSVLGVTGLAIAFHVVTRMEAPVETMPNDLLRLGYLGSVLTVAGAAYLMTAVVLVSVHRVVPHSPGRPPGPAGTAALPAPSGQDDRSGATGIPGPDSPSGPAAQSSGDAPSGT